MMMVENEMRWNVMRMNGSGMICLEDFHKAFGIFPMFIGGLFVLLKCLHLKHQFYTLILTIVWVGLLQWTAEL